MSIRRAISTSVLALTLASGTAIAQSEAEPAKQPDPIAAASILAGQIESSPEDDRAASWMLDLAELKLAEVAQSCDDVSVMFGIPTAAQSRRVIEAGASALALVDRAEATAHATVARLEAQLLASDLDAARAAALAEQLDPVLNRLVEHELAARIPNLRMRAAAHAALQDEFKLAGQARRTEALKLLTASKSSDPREQVRVRLLTAAVLLRSSEPLQHVSTARRQLEWIISAVAPAAARAAEPAAVLEPADQVRLQAALLRADLSAAAAKLPCPGRSQDWLVDLLLAESSCAAASAIPGARPEARAAALKQMLDVVRTHSKDGGDADLDSTGELSALRALVYEKVGAATGPGTPWSWLDPEVALARAWSLRSASADKKLDSEAVSLLTRLAERDDAPADVQARAIWMLASESNAPRAHLARIVRLKPATRLATPAADRLLKLVSPTRDQSSPCGFTWADDAARADADAALAVLIVSRPGDSQVLELAVAAAVATAVPTAEQLNRAVELALNFPPAVPRPQQIASCLTSAYDRALAAPIDPASRNLLLRRAELWFGTQGGADPARAYALRLDRVEAAQAAKLNSPAELAAELQPLLGSAIDSPGSSDRARLRITLAIALRESGNAAAAVPLLRSLTDDYEPDVRSTDPARLPAKQAFWSAWSELLEIVRAGEADGGSAAADDRARQAQRLRERLELLDPNLGGEPWAGRIRAASSAKDK